jgi:hypothetical protein
MTRNDSTATEKKTGVAAPCICLQTLVLTTYHHQHHLKSGIRLKKPIPNFSSIFLWFASTSLSFHYIGISLLDNRVHSAFYFERIMLKL